MKKLGRIEHGTNNETLKNEKRAEARKHADASKMQAIVNTPIFKRKLQLPFF